MNLTLKLPLISLSFILLHCRTQHQGKDAPLEILDRVPVTIPLGEETQFQVAVKNNASSLELTFKAGPEFVYTTCTIRQLPLEDNKIMEAYLDKPGLGFYETGYFIDDKYFKDQGNLGCDALSVEPLDGLTINVQSIFWKQDGEKPLVNNPNTQAPVFRSISPSKVRVTFPIRKTTQQKVETITFTRDIELSK